MATYRLAAPLYSTRLPSIFGRAPDSLTLPQGTLVKELKTILHTPWKEYLFQASANEGAAWYWYTSLDSPYLAYADNLTD